MKIRHRYIMRFILISLGLQASNNAFAAAAKPYYSIDSSEIIGSVNAFEIDIYRLENANTNSYVKQESNVVFTKTLGESVDTSGTIVFFSESQYNWKAEATAGKFTLTPAGGEADLSIITSDYNDRVTATNIDIINTSFFDHRHEAFTVGGAISNSKGTINHITADFVANSAAQGGAIHLDQSAVGTISGAFVGNETSLRAGAIEVNSSTVSRISGDFIGNSSVGNAGALLVNSSTVTSLSANFIGNYAASSGGAIINLGEVQSAISELKGDFIANSAALGGGAVYNAGAGAKISTFNGNLIANSSLGKGGAVYNGENAYINFVAKERDVHFTGNYMINAETGARTSNAIYNESINSEATTLDFNAYQTHRISVNDGINGDKNGRDFQIININNKTLYTNEGEDATALEFGRVQINNEVSHQSITLYNGVLELGTVKIDGTSYKASFNNSSLKSEGGRIITDASYLDGLVGNIENAGTIEFTGGTLNKNISGTGNVDINSSLTIGADSSISASSITLSSSGTEHSSISTTADNQLQLSQGFNLKLENADSSRKGWNNFLQWEAGTKSIEASEFNEKFNFTVNGYTFDKNLYKIVESENSYSIAVNEYQKGTYEFVKLEGTTVPQDTLVSTDYSYNASTDQFEPQPVEVKFSGTLGDDYSQLSKLTKQAAEQYFAWQADEASGQLLLKKTSDSSKADVHAFSWNNASIYNDAESENPITSIDHSFIGLHGERGAALVVSDVEMTHVRGDFVGNTANKNGGAIINTQHTIQTLSGSFIGNSAGTTAGAIHNNYAIIGSLVGDFIGNSAKTSGGAIYNFGGDLQHVSSNFIANSAGTAGGAIVNTFGSINFDAFDKSILFAGNYVIDKESKVRTSNAIHNAAHSFLSGPTTLHFNAYKSNNIAVMDGISGKDGSRDSQIININNFTRHETIGLDEEEVDFGRVSFGNTVANQSITVHAGTLQLAEVAASAELGISASRADLQNVALHVKDKGTLDVHNGISLGTGANSITNEGSLIIRTGLVSNTITSQGASATLTLHNGVTVNSELIFKDSASLAESNLIKGVTFTQNGFISGSSVRLQDSTIFTRGTGSITADNHLLGVEEGSYLIEISTQLDIQSVVGELTLHVSMAPDPLLQQYINEGKSVSLLFKDASATRDSDGLSVDSFHNYDSNFIFGNEYNFNRNIHLYVNGQYFAVSGALNTDGGIAFSVIPEPSTATLSLLALAGLLTYRRRKTNYKS